jgi:hypothetical protein
MILTVTTSNGVELEFIRASGIGEAYKVLAVCGEPVPSKRNYHVIYDRWAREFLCMDTGEVIEHMGCLE